MLIINLHVLTCPFTSTLPAIHGTIRFLSSALRSVTAIHCYPTPWTGVGSPPVTFSTFRAFPPTSASRDLNRFSAPRHIFLILPKLLCLLIKNTGALRPCRHSFSQTAFHLACVWLWCDCVAWCFVLGRAVCGASSLRAVCDLGCWGGRGLTRTKGSTTITNLRRWTCSASSRTNSFYTRWRKLRTCSRRLNYFFARVACRSLHRRCSVKKTSPSYRASQSTFSTRSPGALAPRWSPFGNNWSTTRLPRVPVQSHDRSSWVVRSSATSVLPWDCVSSVTTFQQCTPSGFRPEGVACVQQDGSLWLGSGMKRAKWRLGDPTTTTTTYPFFRRVLQLTQQFGMQAKNSVTERVRSVLGTGQDESGSGARNFSRLWRIVNSSCYLLALPSQRHQHVHVSPNLPRWATI